VNVINTEMDSLETPGTSDLDEDSLVMGADSFATERLSTQERLRLAKKRRAEQVIKSNQQVSFAKEQLLQVYLAIIIFLIESMQ
jgi:hypothetical protein